jgi:protein O-GlcNAc transferase
LAGVDALFARAIALEDAGSPEEALAQYRELLAREPLHADAWHNHGLLLARLGRLTDAERSHREYAGRRPRDPRAHSNLADVLVALRRDDEALASLDAALAIAPNDVPLLVRRGVVLSCLQRFDAARRAFADGLERHAQEVERLVLRIAPDASLDAALTPENIFLTRRYVAQSACDWGGWDAYVAQAKSIAAGPPLALEPSIAFMVLHLPLPDAERHALVRQITARIETLAPELPPPGPRRSQRIRVGVISPDFREHLNAYLLRPLFELADRRRFELFAYSLGADDGSPARARIRAAADCFRDLRPEADRRAAQIIRDDDIDILVDAGGYTTGARFAITAQRPARVQVNYLAFPASLGSARVDYAIVDRVAAPGQASWSERLVRLPHTYFLYDYRETPQAVVSRAEYGLPEDAVVFCAFHKAEKITPECFPTWMEILRRVPRSVLWLFQLQAAAENLRRHARDLGVDPARLVFARYETRERYLARLRLADLMLDAVNHSAMTTACDALGMGLPLLAFGGGAAFAARAGESLLRAAGMPELVVQPGEYVETAVRLGANPSALRELRARLAAKRTSAPLFDTAGRVRELEAAFEQML